MESECAGVVDENGPNPPLPPLGSNVSGGSHKLMSGGSFSTPAAHYCPVCGIIATSEANLEVLALLHMLLSDACSCVPCSS